MEKKESLKKSFRPLLEQAELSYSASAGGAELLDVGGIAVLCAEHTHMMDHAGYCRPNHESVRSNGAVQAESRSNGMQQGRGGVRMECVLLYVQSTHAGPTVCGIYTPDRIVWMLRRVERAFLFGVYLYRVVCAFRH